MAKTRATTTAPPRLCPTCGTRVGEAATKCLVCGTDLTTRSVLPGGRPRAIRSPLSPPRTNRWIPLIVVGLVIVLGTGGVMALVNGDTSIPLLNPASPTVTPTVTLTPTETASPTPTETPIPTATPIPPVPYTVKTGDTCIGLAGVFNVSIQSIIELNNLSATCNLFEGQALQIPQPTPTPSPLPSATLSAPEQTAAACQKVQYTVKEGDTLIGIARNYAVDINALMAENGISDSASVLSGQVLSIPLCARVATAGPTPTFTPPPPYAAPSLLVPQDGHPFTDQDETVGLQWASVAVLRDNEYYEVTVEDVTAGTARKLVEYTRATSLSVPTSFRPTDAQPHVFRWSVIPVRQVGTATRTGKPLYEPGGAPSVERTFSWYGSGAAFATPTP